MLKRFVIFCLIFIPIVGMSENITLKQIQTQESQLVGKARFTKFFFDIFDIKLYTKNSTFNWNKPFLIQIHYLRSIRSKTIVNKTIDQIYTQHPKEVRTNKEEYKNIFTKLLPNVEKGSNLYGYMDKDGYGYIYSNSKLIGKIPSKQLSKYFFEIWLGDKASNVKLSKQLRGI